MRRARFSLLAILALSAALGAVSGPSSVQGGALAHERLRLKNTFKSPEEVVSYYCSRDASGFVWSGLLDSERKAFTTWAEAPQQDSFFVAKSYEVRPGTADSGERATVEVHYELAAVGDAHGTRTPPPRARHVVTFDLRKVGGAWKIVKPDYADISPIVLEAKFPSGAWQ